jgi:hypothetical protein
MWQYINFGHAHFAIMIFCGKRIQHHKLLKKQGAPYLYEVLVCKSLTVVRVLNVVFLFCSRRGGQHKAHSTSAGVVA